jgi:hypothetical protein
MNGPLTSLVKKIDEQIDAAAGKVKRPLGVFILFDSKTTGLDNQLRAMATQQGLKRVSLCIDSPPADYGVSPEADVTVVIYHLGKRRGEKVTGNFALRKGELTEAKEDAIVTALSKVLPQ